MQTIEFAQGMTLRRALVLLALIMAGWLPSLLKADVVFSATALYPFAEAPNPYYVSEHAFLLYFWSPLVAVSGCLFFLSPGLFLALALNRAGHVSDWLISGLALTVPVICIPTAIIQAMVTEPLRGPRFAAVVIACSLVSFSVLMFRLLRNNKLAWPLGRQDEYKLAVMLVVFPLLIVALLVPKIYWENFTRDGLQVLESSRLLYYQPFPFWPQREGVMLTYPGFNSMVSIYIPSWFVRVFGEIEAPARFPFLLYLVAVFCGIVSIVNHKREETSKLSTHLLVWLALGVYTVVVVFNVSYNPYAADIAHPAAREVLGTAFFLGFVSCFLNGDRYWTSYFVLLTFLTVPLGAMLIGLWLLGVLFLWQPRPWKLIVSTAAAMLACQLLVEASPWLLAILGHPPPGELHSSENLLKRLDLHKGSIQRIAYLIVPCGILPAISLFLWRWQDRIARTLVFVTIAYFTFFYMQRQTALNHYMPAMILPLIVHWRSELRSNEKTCRFFIPATVILAAIAFFVSLPHDARPDISSRLIGSTIEDRIGGYERFDFQAFGRQEILGALFPNVFDHDVPERLYGGIPWVWYHYAHRGDNQIRKINYVIQLASDSPPDSMELFHVRGNVALYIKSRAVWEQHRKLRPHFPPGNTIYAIPRKNLY